MPAYVEDEIWAAIEQALQMNETSLAAMRQRGQETVRQYELRGERRMFLELLGNLEQM